MADGVTYAGALAACVGLAAIVRAVVRRPLSRSELEYAAAFWRRAALRAVWRGGATSGRRRSQSSSTARARRGYARPKRPRRKDSDR